MSDYVERARRMVRGARLLAVSSFIPMLDRFPQLSWILEQKKVRDWDLLMAVAAVGAALYTSSAHLSEADILGVLDTIDEELQSLHPQGPVLLHDLNKFLVKNLKAGFEAGDVVGFWLITNLNDGWPSDEQAGPARPIGIYLLQALKSWWEE